MGPTCSADATSGDYCGGDKVDGGDANTLYTCAGQGPAVVKQACANGCVVAPGQNDACAPPPEPDFDSIPWEKGAAVGNGIARKDSKNPLGENVFIAYAGWNVSLDASCKWLAALYHADLHDRGVRYLYCVKGPADPTYSTLEISNSKMIAHILTKVSDATKFVAAAANSSGSYVAYELIRLLNEGKDPNGVLQNRVVFFDLDGRSQGLYAAAVNRLRKAYFVGAYDAAAKIYSANYNTMTSLGSTYAANGGFYKLDATGSGCTSNLCVHVTPVTTKPHYPDKGDAIDFADFVNRPVQTKYLVAKAMAAGMVP